MRLLFAESSASGYGTEQHAISLALAMSRRGHDVRCLASAGTPVESALRAQGIPTIAVRPGGGRGLRMAASLLLTVCRRWPGWVISNDPRFYRMFALLRRFSGVRTAIFRHWHDAPRKRHAREILAREVDRLILVSEFQREDYCRQGMNVERASILYNPIDTERFAPSAEWRSATRERLGIDASHILVGFFGRIIREKGVFTLFEAAERFLDAAPEARMLWVGDGEELGALRDRIQGSALRARHILRGWEPDLAPLYPALDLLVVPSLYPEPFGRVSVEAQAAGVPVVCTSVGGLPETLLPEMTGLLLPGTESEPLAAAVLRLVRDGELRHQMGLAGTSWARAQFSFERIARDFEALLEGCGSTDTALGQVNDTTSFAE